MTGGLPGRAAGSGHGIATPRQGIAKRSVMIAGHRTSVSLEPEFWEALQDVARARNQSVQALIGTIDAACEGRNLSSAIRVFVLGAVRSP